MTISITKGKVAREDLKQWDGRASRQFTRPTSTGGTATLTQVGDSVDVFTVYGNSTDQTDTSITTAISRAKAPAILDLIGGTWTINNDLTIPADVFIRFNAGAIMDIANGVTVTFTGGILADKWQIFTGSGTLTGTPQNTYLVSKWYSDATLLTVSLTGILIDNLGTAATHDVGTGDDDIPTNSTIGSAGLRDVGTDEDAISTNEMLGGAAFYNVAVVGEVFGGSDEVLVTPKYVPWPFGQCQFNYTSATVYTLSRRDGTKLFINGSWYDIPSAGVALGTGGLSASTFYYVYAYISSGAITLEASATAYAISSTYGNQIKAGDAAKVLIGWVMMNSSTQFDPNFVYSWFNSPSLPRMFVVEEQAANTAGGSSTAGSFLTRVLNTIKQNTIPGAALSSNKISLPAGRYRIRADQPLRQGNLSQALIYNVTGAANLLIGLGGISQNSTNCEHIAKVEGDIVLAGTTEIDLRYQVGTGYATSGLGSACNFGVVETYSRVLVEKLS
jgi:hypothetical protein